MRRLAFPRTVRARLTLWNVLVLALVLVALGGILRTIASRNLRASMDADLLARTRRYTEFWAAWPGPLPKSQVGTPGTKPPPPRELHGPPAEPVGPKTRWRAPIDERVFAPDGMQVFPRYQGDPPWDWSAFEKATRGQDGYSGVKDGDISLRVYTALLRIKSGEVVGVVQVAESLEEVTQALRNLDQALMAIVPIGLLAVWWGGMSMMGRMLRPIREITRTAEHIGAQDLSRRIAVSGQDEFSELADTLNGMLARLEASFEQQRRFTADSSHELRTPLTVVKSAASRLLARKDLPDDYRRGMERLNRAADTMERTIQDLLLLARSDSGQLEPQLSPVFLSSIVDAALACVAAENGPTIHNEVSDSPLAMIGDASHLTRLFANLLENAVRHTPAEGHITVSARQEGERIRVCVSDTGIGIPPEHLPHVVERFYRVDAARTRAQGGAGLGLAICKGIVEAHGGAIHVESAPGQGTTVEIALPAAADMPPTVAVSRADASLPPGRRPS